MKQRAPAVFLCLLLTAASIGCGSKGNTTAAGQVKASDDEAQQVAEKFGDLLISKCAGGYMFGMFRPLFFPPPHLYPTPFIVKAKPVQISPHSIGHFYGYEWIGYVEITRPEWGDGQSVSEAGFEIYKRGGEWFYRPGEREGQLPAFGDTGSLEGRRATWPEGRESDIPINSLRSISAACPK